MSTSMRKVGKTAIIRVEGKLSLGQAVDEFRARWSDALATGIRHVVVDLTAVPAVDSSGIGSIVRCHSAVRGNGGKLKVVGAAGLVKQAFELTHLHTVLEMHDDEQSAVAALGAGAV